MLSHCCAFQGVERSDQQLRQRDACGLEDFLHSYPTPSIAQAHAERGITCWITFQAGPQSYEKQRAITFNPFFLVETDKNMPENSFVFWPSSF